MTVRVLLRKALDSVTADITLPPTADPPVHRKIGQLHKYSTGFFPSDSTSTLTNVNAF